MKHEEENPRALLCPIEKGKIRVVKTEKARGGERWILTA
jgi:hypothetical protein